MTDATEPGLIGVYLPPERVPADAGFPFDLPCVRDLDLRFPTAVTFFVGENGSGKSTLMEALAEAVGLPSSGGGRNDLPDRTGPRDSSALGAALRPMWRRRARDGFFFRAEHTAHFAELLDEREANEDFRGDPYVRYGGRSLHHRSHGEAFLAILQGSVEGDALLLMDEPESALSPQRQLALLAQLDDRVAQGAQIIAATHSPLLLTFPGATIYSLDDGPPRPVSLEETSHYQLTRDVLSNPGVFWRHLRGRE